MDTFLHGETPRGVQVLGQTSNGANARDVHHGELTNGVHPVRGWEVPGLVRTHPVDVLDLTPTSTFFNNLIPCIGRNRKVYHIVT